MTEVMYNKRATIYVLSFLMICSVPLAGYMIDKYDFNTNKQHIVLEAHASSIASGWGTPYYDNSGENSICICSLLQTCAPCMSFDPEYE